MTQRPQPTTPSIELIATRWSPYAFADRPVPHADLLSLFEAARWAASSYNEQPWSYVVAMRENPQEFAQLLSCLVEGNQAWAKHAPVLALGCTSLRPGAGTASPTLQRSTILARPPATWPSRPRPAAWSFIR